MTGRKFFLLVFLGLAMVAAAFLIYPKFSLVKFATTGKKTISIQNQNSDIDGSNSSNKNFYISGWLPYWRKSEGVNSVKNNLDEFDEINPFAYGVDSNGDLIDRMAISSSPWPELFQTAGEKKVKIAPAILWGDASAMHKIFTDQNLQNVHINNITKMLNRENMSGVDIDYEGKDVADKDNFTLFLKNLSDNLRPLGKTLECTVEARTSDSVPPGFSGTRAMSWANDFSALNDYCDSVKIMAYDQVFQIYRANTFNISGDTAYAPNADKAWAKEVMLYALKYIAPQKLILGVPTYGWEFKVNKTAEGYQYQRVGSVNYSEAIKIAGDHDSTPARTAGGELSFTYKSGGQNYFVIFEDAHSLQDKMNIAKDLDIKGISLFKIDGEFDPEIMTSLEKARN